MAKKLTSEEFYDRVKIIHSGKYTYLNDFTNTRNNITCFCPNHGKFLMSAKRHLQGQGCPKCGKEYAKLCRKGNWCHFIERTNKKFSDSLLFPNIREEYENEKSFVTVVCNRCRATKKIQCSYLLDKKYPTKCTNCKYLYSFDELIKLNRTVNNIDRYEGLKDSRVDSVEMACKEHGKYNTKVKNIIEGNGKCKKCSGHSKRLTEQIAIERLNNKFNCNLTVISPYVKSQENMTFLCKNGHTFNRTFNNAIYGNLHNACQICSKLEMSNDRRKTTDDFKREFYKIFSKNDYDLSEAIYSKYNEQITIKCNICGKYITKTPSLFLKGYGCDNHGNRFTSKMEICVEKLLADNNIKYIKQYRPSWLRNKSLDFYLPKYNIAIECQGRQHFESVEYFGGVDEFNKRKYRDSEKMRECNENNVRLIYYADYEYSFPYDVITDKNELIECIMDTNGENANKRGVLGEN